MRRHSLLTGPLERLIFPAWMFMSIWPVVAASVLSGVGNFFGSKSAAKENAAAQDRANATNLQMFRESRGSTGSAVLPEYLKAAEGELAGSAADVARAMFGYGGGPTARLAASERTLSRYNPAIEAGDGLVFDLASGKVAENRRAGLAPVLAARTKLAKTRAAQINESLDETLAGLRAARTASGFRGMSTFDTNRALAATTNARARAAGELGAAELENALAMQSLDDGSLQMMLGALDLPFARGQQQMAFRDIPLRSVSDGYGAALAPLSFFRMGAANPPYVGANPGPSNGALAGAAISGLGSNLGQYFMQQQTMRDLSRYFGGGSMASADNGLAYA